MAQLSFFLGKGGVGKTTVSSSYAIWMASRHPRKKILLISTDPAHSLGDILQANLNDKPKRVIGPGKLYARQIDPAAQVSRFLDAEREGILSVVEGGTFFTRAEVEPLLDATLPGMAEVAALVALHDLLQNAEYDEIVVDTAPMGHTLRLFEMPEHFGRFLKFMETASSRDDVLAQTFARRRIAPNPYIAAWQEMVSRVRNAVTGVGSRLVLVTTPEPFALNESVRAAEWLSASDLKLRIDEVVLNRAMKKAGTCSACRERVQASRAALRFLDEAFAGCEVRVGEDPGGPILGAASLGKFGAHVFAGRALRLAPRAANSAEVKLVPSRWPELQTPLTLTVGKGGVGKTTISAALAYHARRTKQGQAVTICSTDPAPSLDDIFDCEVRDEPRPVLGDKMLLAAEFDAVAQYRRWAGEMQTRIRGAMSAESGGLHLDMSFDREVLVALLDIVPPGVDEIFATFRILEMVTDRERVVIDMAPTGHALELLRTPERLLTWARLLLKTLAAHRTLPLAQDAAVEVATISQNVRELSKVLRDAKTSAVFPVMLAEPLPDRETERLLQGLRELDAPVAALFVNRVLVAEDVRRCARCARSREWQLNTLAHVKKRFRGIPVYVVRNVPGGVSGKSGLQSITEDLWQMQ